MATRMRHRCPFRPIMAAGGLCLALFAAGDAGAQGNPVAPAVPGLAGACGQPMALTHLLGLPLDQVAPSAAVPLPLDRLEPAYVEFALSAPAGVTLRTASPTDHDTFLALFDATGRLIATDDDSAGGLQALLEDRALAPGRYCAQVRVYGWENNTAARATLTLEAVGTGAPVAGAVPGADPSRPCGDPALVLDAGRLVAPDFGGLSLTATVAEGARRDWRMTVAAPLTLQLEALSPQFDTVLELYDAAGRLVAENDDRPQGGTDSEIIERLAPGDYCISVRGWGGGGGAVQVVLSESAVGGAPMPGPAMTDAPCGDPALTLDAGQLAQGFGRQEVPVRVGDASRQDVLFVLVADAGLTLEALGRQGFDTVLELHDASGGFIAENDDRPQGGTDSEIIVALSAGSYCATVRGFAGAGGEAVLALSEGTAPAGLSPGPGMPGAASPGPLPGFPGTGGSMAGDAPCGDPARTVALGAAIGSGLPALALTGQVERDGWADWSLSATAQAEARLTARSTSFDTMLELYDARGSLVAENDDAPGMGTDSEIVAPLPAGEYCLRVLGYAGGGGDYTLAVATVGGPAAPAAPPPGGLATGTSLEPPAPGTVIELGALAEVIEASRTETAATLWFGFAVTEGGRFDLQGLSLGGPLVMQLSDSDGGALQEAQAGGGFDIAQMSTDLDPGTYLVALHWPGGEGRAAVRQLVVTRQ